jgi:hypothetical protein
MGLDFRCLLRCVMSLHPSILWLKRLKHNTGFVNTVSWVCACMCVFWERKGEFLFCLSIQLYPKTLLPDFRQPTYNFLVASGADLALIWMFVPRNSCVVNLLPKIMFMVFEGRIFGRWLSHKSSTLITGLIHSGISGSWREWLCYNRSSLWHACSVLPCDALLHLGILQSPHQQESPQQMQFLDFKLPNLQKCKK